MSATGILLVDDEALALKYFTKTFGDRFPIYSAPSAQEALQILQTDHSAIGIIVTDQRMPDTTGIELLKTVRNQYPQITRILTTAYTELDLLVAAINIGAVHSFIAKPWHLPELEKILLTALEHHETQILDTHLIDQKLDHFQAKLLDDKAYDIGMIATKIGHYVHNALCPLTFLLDQLVDQNQATSSYPAEFLQNIRAHVYDVARTLKDLEKASEPIAAADCQSLDLNQMVDQALADTEIIRNQKRLRFEKVSSHRLPPPIQGATTQIENLFRFMITEEIVSLPADSLVRLHLSAREENNQIVGAEITFEDFVPIPSHERPEDLLHPFNLRGSNPREFGVFLASCYFIAHHHGGSLQVRTKKDAGLFFSFFLPCHPGEPVSSENKLPARQTFPYRSSSPRL